ncbi:MAG: hypothetical protein SWH78_01185 [Thermodesulfobacteriota bacterium]|nr:hypothetical protein [Thermodesulfobacteriota bacterium]
MTCNASTQIGPTIMQWMGLDLAEPFKPFTAGKKDGLFTRTIPAMRKSSDRTIMVFSREKGSVVDQTGHGFQRPWKINMLNPINAWDAARL